MNKLQRIYYDIESCGLYGVPVIIQYAVEDGPIEIYEFWRNPIGKSKRLIEWLMSNITIGFNLAFDHFMLQKWYNILEAYGDDDAIPIEDIKGIAAVEKAAMDGLCIKPAGALDLFLYAKKTDLQVTMERGDVIVRRVPTVLAWKLAELLDNKIQLDPILFAGYKKKNMPRFVVRDIEQTDGTMHPSLKNVVLKFRPSAGLKAIAEYKLGAKTTQYSEIEIDRMWYPREFGYAPFAECNGVKPKVKRNFKFGKTQKWPEVVEKHIDHWAYNDLARQYASDDITYTRELDRLWNYPAHSDDDSILACSVASCRWKGYRLDLPKLRELIENYKARLKYPISPRKVREYLRPVMSEIEWAASRLETGTAKKILEDLRNLPEWKDHPVQERAGHILEARAAKKKIELLEKLYVAGRFHPSVKVIGALSGRMSGADGLNAHGIDKTKEVRSCFPLAFEDEVLMGGDMQSFEISIAAADYNDPKLTASLMTCEKCNVQVTINDRGIKLCQTCIDRENKTTGIRCDRCTNVLRVSKEFDKKKGKDVEHRWCYTCQGAETKSFHALFAMGFWPDMTYEEIMATKGTENPIYNYAKNAGFATLYGAQAAKIALTLKLDEDTAQEGFLRFWRTYAVAGRKRKQVESDFTTLYSSDMGGRINRKKPLDHIESLLGFRRYFTLENNIIGQLYETANSVPPSWLDIKTKIIRSKRGEQSVGNAIRSALYGSAFATQNSIIRQAANHRIQSTGAGITKAVQVAAWSLQPSGVHPWRVRPFQIHDELQIATNPNYTEQLTDIIYKTVEKFRPIVPLIGIDFGRLGDWGEK